MTRGKVPDIEVLISTMHLGEAPGLLADRLGIPDDVAVLVVNQCRGDERPEDVRVGSRRLLSYEETGLSRSRNRALEAAQGRLLILADDDISYLPGAFDVIRRAFQKTPKADVIRFRFARGADRALSASEGEQVRPWGHLETMRVASVELAFKRSALEGHAFDESFGLGARYPGGEEAIFLRDLEREGLALFSCESLIVHHPQPSSGHVPWSEDVARQKGATLARLYPVFWPVFIGVFTVTKSRFYRHLGVRVWLRESLRGAREIRLPEEEG